MTWKSALVTFLTVALVVTVIGNSRTLRKLAIPAEPRIP